jgi:hypothetical protein
MKAMRAALCVVFVVLLAGCSGGADLGAGGETGAEPPTCEITASGGKVRVVIHLPEEETDYEDTHDLTPAGFSGTPSEVTIDSPASEVSYSQTGNTYEIGYKIVYKNGDISSYTVTVAGNVYGEVIHTLSK